MLLSFSARKAGYELVVIQRRPARACFFIFQPRSLFCSSSTTQTSSTLFILVHQLLTMLVPRQLMELRQVGQGTAKRNSTPEGTPIPDQWTAPNQWTTPFAGMSERNTHSPTTRITHHSHTHNVCNNIIIHTFYHQN